MAWIVLHSLVTGKKQRVLWLIVVSISILVPLMIFKTSVSSLDFPMLRAASDSSNVEIETSATSINYSGEIGQLLNVSFDGVTTMVDNQGKHRKFYCRCEARIKSAKIAKKIGCET